MHKTMKYLTVSMIALFPSVSWAQSQVNVEQIDQQTLASVRHSGNQNSTVIVQDGRSLEATVEITGSGNNANGYARTVEQTGEGSSAEISVLGDDNRFSVSQTGANGPANNLAMIDIVGNENEAAISQINDLGALYSNTAYIQQAGDRNAAFITQVTADTAGQLFGTDNLASITQRGDENYAEVQQHGTGNEAGIEQDGDNNFGSITQLGVGSSLVLNQYGNNKSFELTQTGCLVSSCDPVAVYQGAPPPGY